MKEVKANLKAMSQWPAVWVLYGVLGLIELCLTSSACENLSNDPSGFVGAWWVLSSLILGISISAIQMSIVGKTLAFMLPGHERGVRQILFGFGGAVIGLLSLVFLSSPGLSQTAYIGLYLSAFCLGMFCYWLGVAVVLIWGMKYVAILFIFGVIVFSVGRWIELFIVKLPILSIGLGAATTGGFWWLLNQPEFFKHYCRQTWYQSAAIAISEKRQPLFAKTNPIPARPGWLETIVEKFFLERMRSCKSGGMARYLWGQLYEMLGPKIIWWKPIWDLLTYIVFILIFGYMIIEEDANSFLFPCVVLPAILLETFEYGHSTPLMTGGRCERFVAVMTNAISLAVLMTSILVVACIVSIPLEWVLPNINSGREEPMIFHSFPMRFCWIPFFLVPLSCAVHLVSTSIELTRVIGVLLVCCVLPFWLFGTIREISDSVLLIWAISLICASWLILGVVDWYVSKKWSLIRTWGTW